MSSDVVVYGFETSNNIKVRVSLGYKGIGYEFRTIDPKDRSEVVRISRQHLTPVMVHGERVVFDSAAIMRYLDFEFPQTPKLYGNSRNEQWEIEDWELYSRAVLAGPMMEVVHRRVSGDEVDDAMMSRCTAEYAAAAEKLVRQMDGRQWLVGDAMSAADVSSVAVVMRIRKSEIFAEPSAVKRVADWIDRVMRFDAGPGGK